MYKPSKSPRPWGPVLTSLGIRKICPNFAAKFTKTHRTAAVGWRLVKDWMVMLDAPWRARVRFSFVEFLATFLGFATWPKNTSYKGIL